jgi:RNA polymerase sigma factor (sigma-70 family)
MATSQMSEFLQQLRKAVLPRDGAGLTDGQLLDDYLRRRDEAALSALVCRHGPMVWGVCRRILRYYHDAEDAFQATFLVLVRKAASVVPREMVANWLYGVAHQTALKVRATTAKRGARETHEMQMPEPRAKDHDLWDDLRPLLDHELSRLPDKYRVAIVFCDLAGKTRKEAAQQLGVPEGTLAARVARGRVMLAKRLARHGLGVTAAALATTLTENASAFVPNSVLAAAINAASALAAGNATAGVVSAKVVALMEGALKSMLLTKLKTATAVLLMFAVVGGAAGLLYQAQAGEPPKAQSANGQPQAPKHAESDQSEQSEADLSRLQGTWRLVSSEFDGMRFGQGRREIKDTRLVIEKSSFIQFSKLFHSPNIPLPPEDIKVAGTLTLDTKRHPSQIVLTWEQDPWNNKTGVARRGIYSLAGDSLRICLSMDEDAKTLPTEFSAPFGSKRTLLIFKRDSAKEGATYQTREGEPATDKKEKQSAKTPNVDKDKLQGTWRLASLETDGLRISGDRPALKETRLVIREASLELFYTPEWQEPQTNKPETKQAVAEFPLDAQQTPNVMVLTWKESPWNGKNGLVWKAIYAADGDILKLCWSNETEAPTEFSADAGNGRMLWTFKRDPASDKRAEKKAVTWPSVPGRE